MSRHLARKKQGPACPTTRERSRLMARVRRTGTGPELALRCALRRAGIRYRVKSRSKLPGSPDIIIHRLLLAIFVDGCFWHGCPRHGSLPKTNTAFWIAKIVRNQKRDKQADKSLRTLGWKVLRIWEHDLRGDLGRIVSKIQRVISSDTSPQSKR